MVLLCSGIVGLELLIRSQILGLKTPAFRVKLGANDLNCVDVPLNPTHSLKTLFFFTTLFVLLLFMSGFRHPGKRFFGKTR